MFPDFRYFLAGLVFVASWAAAPAMAEPDYVKPPRNRLFNVHTFSDGLAQVHTRVPEKDLYGYGFVDTEGELVVDPEYDEAEAFHEGRAAVARYGDEQPIKRWGFVDRNGKVVVGLDYIDAHSFSDGLAAVKTRSGDWQFIDRAGKPVLEVEPSWHGVDAHNSRLHHPLNDFHNGWLWIVDGDDGFNFIDRNGHKLREQPYPQAQPFSDGLAKVALRAETVSGPKGDNELARMYAKLPGPEPKTYDWAVIDTQGKVRFRLPEDVTRLGRFINARAPFYRDGHWGIIDDQGHVVVPARYDHKPRGYGEDVVLFAVDGQRSDNRDGYIETLDHDGQGIARIPFADDQGRVIVDAKHQFHEGLLGVELATGLGKDQEFKTLGWGFIDAHGQLIVEPQFNGVNNFADGRAFVTPKDAGGAGLIRNPLAAE